MSANNQRLKPIDVFAENPTFCCRIRDRPKGSKAGRKFKETGGEKVANLLILGAGQYGSVAKEIAVDMKGFRKIAFLDDNSSDAIGKIESYRDFADEYDCAFVAIGNSELRVRLLQELEQAGYQTVSLIHPMSYISPSAEIGAGSSVEPFAVVQANTVVEKGCIVSSGSVINHNSLIGVGCHIDCNSTVPSNSTVDPFTHICAVD